MYKNAVIHFLISFGGSSNRIESENKENKNHFLFPDGF